MIRKRQGDQVPCSMSTSIEALQPNRSFSKGISVVRRAVYFLAGFVFSLNTAYADQALIDLKFALTNIAAEADPDFKDNIGEIAFYLSRAGVDLDIHEYLSEQPLFKRQVKAKWHIVNYQCSQSLTSASAKGGYHLFDITWYGTYVIIEKRKENGGWDVFLSAVPVFETLQPCSKSTIVNHGDVPTEVSPTVCPGGLCLGGGGEARGRFKERVARTVIKGEYRIRIIEFPLTKSIYLMADHGRFADKLIEVYGECLIGYSVIKTHKNSILFPYDEYLFNVLYTSYYPSKITMSFDDIEDLDLSMSRKIGFSAGKDQTIEQQVKLERKEPFKRYIWNILLVFIPILVWPLEGKLKTRYVRLATYFVTFLAIYFAIPTPLNVPKLNVYNVLIWFLYIIVIAFMEIFSYMKTRR